MARSSATSRSTFWSRVTGSTLCSTLSTGLARAAQLDEDRLVQRVLDDPRAPACPWSPRRRGSGACRGSLRRMRRTSGQKPMSSMRSASSSTSDRRRRPRAMSPCCTMSSRRPGRGDEQVDALADALRLRIVGHAAEHGRHACRPVCVASVTPTSSICAASSRVGRDDEGASGGLAVAGRAAVRRAVMRCRIGQHEGGRLAGARLRAADDVAAGEDVRDGLLLDGRRRPRSPRRQRRRAGRRSGRAWRKPAARSRAPGPWDAACACAPYSSCRRRGRGRRDAHGRRDRGARRAGRRGRARGAVRRGRARAAVSRARLLVRPRRPGPPAVPRRPRAARRRSCGGRDRRDGGAAGSRPARDQPSAWWDRWWDSLHLALSTTRQTTQQRPATSAMARPPVAWCAWDVVMWGAALWAAKLGTDLCPFRQNTARSSQSLGLVREESPAQARLGENRLP